MCLFQYADYVSIYVAKRKNDQFREGHTSYLARSGKSSCPVSVTERIVKSLSQSNASYPLVRRIIKSKSGEYFHASKGVSISTLRDEFKKYIQPFVDDVSKCGTHSMRSVAASNPACRRAYLAIYWICMPGGGVLPRRTDTLRIQLKIV